MFYKNNVKIIPLDLYRYITPLSLSTLFLSSLNLKEIDKAKIPLTLITIKDIKYLSFILKDKYNINVFIHSKFNACKYSSLSLQICNISSFSNVVKPYMLHSQHHLLNKSVINLILPFNQRISNYFSVAKINTTSDKDFSDKKYTVNYKKDYMLNLEQKEAIIGIILGDGFLDRAKPNYNTRLRIEQSYPEKDSYIKSLYKVFESMTSMSPTILTKNDKRNGVITQFLYFRTLSMPCLNYYHDLFYKEKVKIIPRNLNELLTPRGLAY